NAGDYAAAFEPLAAALEQEPDNPLPSAYLAFVAAHQGLIQEARDFITECERIAPHRADLIAAFGETLLKAEQANIAAEYLEKAIGKQPDLYAAYPALGQSLHLCGRHEEAAAILQSVAQIPSAAQTSIRETLLQIQMECGGDSPLKSSMEDGLLRIRITNQCNAQCRFCGIRAWPKHEQSMSMDKTVLYEYCKPLYEKIKILLLTGGDPIAAKEGFNFSRFISENYPRVTLFLESNGIAFTKKWQELAKDNLCTTHFSINGSSAQIYEAGCWASPGGKAYNKTLGHIESYIALLRQSGLEVFAPDISMVINKDTASDVRAFVRKGLEMGVRFCLFYFDYTENNMASPYFGRPETSRPALAELMKLERVLAKKFFIYFRLWIPLKESELLQPQIDAIPLHELEAEYADILVCAQGRSMLREHEERQRIRAERGKKIHTWDEDWTPTIRQTQVGGQTICAAPYQMLDIYPHHAAECCGWITPRIRLDNWIQNGAIDWNRLFNSQQMKTLRQDMLNGGYSLCQKCCPLNPRYNELCSPHRYGFDRVERPCGEIEAPPRTPTPQNLPPQEL
ncbi:MAG: radical SAM protein, partial [Zoogloeaceae bacterium]|nr:radical SAM protein [Zoogloeaceae bacterium]